MCCKHTLRDDVKNGMNEEGPEVVKTMIMAIVTDIIPNLTREGTTGIIIDVLNLKFWNQRMNKNPKAII